MRTGVWSEDYGEDEERELASLQTVTEQVRDTRKELRSARGTRQSKEEHA